MRAAVQSRGYRIDAREYQELATSGNLPVWRLFLVLGVLAVCALLFVRFRSSTERLQAEISDLREKCAASHKEIANLNVQLERYTSPQHILNGIARFDLGLGMPQSGQVRRVSLDDEGSEVMRSGSSVETAYRLDL